VFSYLTVTEQRYTVSSETLRVDRKRVGFGGSAQDEHLGASAGGILVPIPMRRAPGVLWEKRLVLLQQGSSAWAPG